MKAKLIFKYLTLLAISISLIACSSSKETNTPKADKKQEKNTSTKLNDIKEKEVPTQKEKEVLVTKGYTVVSKEIKIFKGRLSTTKGNQAVINSILIDNDFIKEKDSQNWKKEYKNLIGKTIEVKGRLSTYHCGSMEQCMTSGVIKFLKEIQYIRVAKRERPMLKKKPILYLYPENDTDISIKLKYSENIAHSYPKYPKNGWKVKAKKDGTIIYNNKKYYSLFWEMLDYGDFKFNEGFIVKRSELIPFLEKSLKTLGLNFKESQEFIIFWLPILEKNELTLIKFETSEYNKKQPIEILPKPDTLIRIMMHYKKVDANLKIKKQVLPEGKRIGFTAIEWGGMEVE